MFDLSVRILSVAHGSLAEKAGIKPDERIVAVNGEPILDEIDYQALTSSSALKIEIEKDGLHRSVTVKKEEWEPLGLSLDETEAMKPRHCQNKCMFCFVDQLPQGLRETLYVKDDDWRLSLMMGNYVTLTNVNEKEFERIIARKASPLYISVHATDPDVRCSMLSNPSAGKLMERLRRLKENGLQFHCQIVLCPGVNDGSVLCRTIEDLASLFPAAVSLAIVPVGLTMFRDGLHPLKGFDSKSARDLLELVSGYQSRFLRELGTRFVYPSDEFYCISGSALPKDEEYEDYDQIENGVGMLRKLELECAEAAEDLRDLRPEHPSKRSVLIPTGVSAGPFIEKLAKHYAPEGTSVEVIPVINHFFGESITVTGLIVGRDLMSAIKGKDCDIILICDTMLRENTDRFLDDMTVLEVQNGLGKPVRIVRNTGDAFIRALWNLEEQND